MDPFRFQVEARAGRARVGRLFTPHGAVETPLFMPVGTAGSVKGLMPKDLEAIGSQVLLTNTYHLLLRPGPERVRALGGLHGFAGWKGPWLTDSGGFQVMSLGHMRRIDEEGVVFQSHLDGRLIKLTPERSIAVQEALGADLIMAFDECTPYPCDYAYARQSMEMTHRWLLRCQDRFDTTEGKYGYNQSLFPIVQGSVYKDLRVQSAEFIAKQGREGNAIGGLSVGEPAEMMYEMTELVTAILPVEKPRYLMGVGTPANILECIALGVDMFDCVMPTRNARNGMLFTSEGIINIRNEKWKDDFSAIDPAIGNEVSSTYTKAYLRHLTVSKEILAAQIASIHNLSFYLWLVGQAREHIQAGDFGSWKTAMVQKVSTRL